MEAANLQKLRIKYRKIIQGEDSDQSNEEIRKSITFMKPKAGMRVLTEHCENFVSQKVKDSPSNSVFIALKQRIAQGLKQLSQKQQEIEAYKQQLAKQKFKISLLQSQLSQQQSSIQQRNTKIAEQKLNATSLQREIQKLKQTLQDQCIDKELAFKQSEFYKKQIKQLKADNNKLIVKLQQQQKEINLIQTMKNNNSRLKQNIKRMQEIIDQCCQEKINIDLTDKYYLGKPNKQYNCWFAQNLVAEVQLFLRKWQMGANNKEFINSLVKFIDQTQKKSNKDSGTSSKSKIKKSASKMKQSKKHFNSAQICFFDAQSIQKSLKKSIYLNKHKKRNKTRTNSLLEDEQDLRTTNPIQQYQKVRAEALKQQEINPNKILQINQELKQYFTTSLDQNKIGKTK